MKKEIIDKIEELARAVAAVAISRTFDNAENVEHNMKVVERIKREMEANLTLDYPLPPGQGDNRIRCQQE